MTFGCKPCGQAIIRGKVVGSPSPIMYMVFTLLEMHLPTSFFSSSFVDSLGARSKVSWPLVKHRV